MIHCGDQRIEFRVFILIEMIKVADSSGFGPQPGQSDAPRQDGNPWFSKALRPLPENCAPGPRTPGIHQQGALFAGFAQE